MSAQAIFYRKNYVDISRSDVTITITDNTASDDGQSYVDFMRNRNNRSFWLTTGSDDAANTQIDVELADSQTFSDIILVEHNFDSFTIQYDSGSGFTDFSTPINESGNTDSTTVFNFDEVTADKVRIIITGTQTTDDDKRLGQLYICQRIADGQLVNYPRITQTHSTNKKINRLLSGKVNVIESIGATRMSLSVENWKVQGDITILENLFFNRQGFHVYLSGGNEAQFAVPTVGYRKKDIYFMRPTNDYEPVLARNYRTGYNLSIDLEECIE